jgi:hypothetical protein
MSKQLLVEALRTTAPEQIVEAINESFDDEKLESLIAGLLKGRRKTADSYSMPMQLRDKAIDAIQQAWVYYVTDGRLSVDGTDKKFAANVRDCADAFAMLIQRDSVQTLDAAG